MQNHAYGKQHSCRKTDRNMEKINNDNKPKPKNRHGTVSDKIDRNMDNITIMKQNRRPPGTVSDKTDRKYGQYNNCETKPKNLHGTVSDKIDRNMDNITIVKQNRKTAMERSVIR